MVEFSLAASLSQIKQLKGTTPMALIAEELTSANPFAEGSAETIKALAALPSKAAKLTFVKETYSRELQSLRDAARDAGYTLAKIADIPEVEGIDADKVPVVTVGYKLRPKVQIAPGIPRPSRAKTTDDEPLHGDE